MGRPLWLVAAGAGMLALVLLLLSVVAWRERRRFGALVQTLLAVVLLLLASLTVAVGMGMRGYRALTRETRAATVEVTPLGPRTFRAAVHLRDGTSRTVTIRGDALYVDAQILKWTPAATLLGLHTAYRLDRIAGRYDALDDEQTEPRTVYALHEGVPVDLFAVARRYPVLAPVLDAAYGSGTFIPLGDGGSFDILVSTTGLLVRPTRTDRVPATPPSR